MKTVSKVLVLALALVMIVGVLSACGGGSKDKGAVGTYTGLYTKFVGDGDDAKDESSPFSLELKAGGKGVHHRDDLDLDVTWTLDGENITMTESFLGAKMEYTGTLSGNSLHLFNGDPEDIWTCEYVYEKN